MKEKSYTLPEKQKDAAFAAEPAPATVKPVPNHFKFPFNELAIV